MKLLIARSNFFSYSETFIDQQIKQLNPFAVLYEGWQPTRFYSGGSLYPFPLSLLAVRGTLRNLFPAIYQKIYTYFLKKYLQKNQIEAVLANYGPLGSNVMQACAETNIPFSVHFHGFDASEKKTIEAYGLLYIQMAQQAKAIIAVSQVMKTDIESVCGPLTNLHIVPYGVDLEKFQPAPEKKSSKEFRLISVGRFTAKKAPIASIQSFEILLNAFPEATFTMIGDGELWEAAKQYVQQHGLDKSVIFRGQQNPETILDALQQADAFIQHSVLTPSGDSEGTPNSILEASACSLPIVSTKHAGIPEAVVNGETGILVDEHDVKAMGQALIRLAENVELREKMGQAARKHMLAHYELASQAQKLKSLL
ncbi:MAG: putative colanic acid biosynthesis glycosyltransferase WcaL [Bacteroidota bacterium]|jgi:glycosyltransferase involved in cell wall biosynthesis